MEIYKRFGFFTFACLISLSLGAGVFNITKVDNDYRSWRRQYMNKQKIVFMFMLDEKDRDTNFEKEILNSNKLFGQIWDEFFQEAPSKQFEINYHISDEQKVKSRNHRTRKNAAFYKTDRLSFSQNNGDVFMGFNFTKFNAIQIKDQNKHEEYFDNTNLLKFEAQIQLLKSQLQNKNVEKFYLIFADSVDSAITPPLPLYDFQTIYQQAKSSNESFMEILDRDADLGNNAKQFKFLLENPNFNKNEILIANLKTMALHRNHAYLLSKEGESFLKQFGEELIKNVDIPFPYEAIIPSILSKNNKLDKLMNTPLTYMSDVCFKIFDDYNLNQQSESEDNCLKLHVDEARKRGSLFIEAPSNQVMPNNNGFHEIVKLLLSNTTQAQIANSSITINPFTQPDFLYQQMSYYQQMQPIKSSLFTDFGHGKLIFLLVAFEYLHQGEAWDKFFQSSPHNSLFQIYVGQYHPTHNDNYFNMKTDVQTFLRYDIKNKDNNKKPNHDEEMRFMLTLDLLQEALGSEDQVDSDEIYKVIIVSESCIPVYDFTTFYRILVENDLKQHGQSMSYLDIHYIDDVNQGDRLVSHFPQMILNVNQANQLLISKDDVHQLKDTYPEKKPNSFVIGTFLDSMLENTHIFSQCVSHQVLDQQNQVEIYRLGHIKKNNILNARMNGCFFHTNLHYMASVADEAYNFIYPKIEPQMDQQCKEQEIESCYKQEL
eukprot:403347151